MSPQTKIIALLAYCQGHGHETPRPPYEVVVASMPYHEGIITPVGYSPVVQEVGAWNSDFQNV